MHCMYPNYGVAMSALYLAHYNNNGDLLHMQVTELSKFPW